MKTTDHLTGRLAELPDCQLVKIEIVHDDGYASVRRMEGERKGTRAICALDKLQISSPEDIAHVSKSVI